MGRTATDVVIAIPTHCSALSSSHQLTLTFPFRGEDETAVRLSHSEHAKVKRTASSASSSVLSVVLVQCLGDRTMWHALRPILLESEPRFAEAAAVLLIRAFYGSRTRMTLTETCYGAVEGAEEEPVSRDGARQLSAAVWDVRGITTLRRISLGGPHTVQTGIGNCGWTAAPMSRPEDEPATRRRHRRTRQRRAVLLVALPPRPSPLGGPLRAERIFASSLVSLENKRIRLQTLNAFIATLGGGYFLCRHLTTAVALARSQRAVAMALNDRDLAGRCTVNEAYNYVHAGKIGTALQILRKEREEALGRGDGLTVQMCMSAILFGKRVRRASLYESEFRGALKKRNESLDDDGAVLKGPDGSRKRRTDDHAKDENSLSTTPSMTHDDFQRIRIVRDRTRT